MTDFYDNHSILNQKLFKLNHNKDIILRRCYIDELGLSYLRNNGFNPVYNYYRKNNKLIIRLEAPGNIRIEAKIRLSQRFTIIYISGKKKIDNEPLNIEDNMYNTREFGDFDIEIPLLMNLENKRPKIEKKEGIIFIEYEIREDGDDDINKTMYYNEDEV